MPTGASSSHLYLPKIVTSLREGYGVAALRADALAGLTVAVVALPLSMAIAVASGVSPERGLYTAIIGGAIVSLLGGSRFQIGGPAGAFIVLVAATVSNVGVDGLFLTVLLSGVMLCAVGLSGLGAMIRYIPHAVTIGFTSGIAVTIFASQIRDFAGLHLAVPEPGPLVPKLIALTDAATTFTPEAMAISVGSAAFILAVKALRPTWPGMLAAVVIASILVVVFKLPVETIGGRFGDLPRSLPMPHLPEITIQKILQVLPAALSFTLLGGVESLLSAKVADTMTGRVHRSNMELLAQGAANIGSALFGGISVTGTIARTATNVRAGAVSPISGILHSAFIALFLLIAAPLAGYVPLSALAGVLAVVCWNMAEREQFRRILQGWPGATVLLLTFGITLVRDLTQGIVAGCVAAAIMTAFGRSIPKEGV